VQCAIIGKLGDDLQFFFTTRERQSSGLAVQSAELISSFSKFGTPYAVRRTLSLDQGILRGL
jgi:hypothetical protein